MKLEPAISVASDSDLSVSKTGIARNPGGTSVPVDLRAFVKLHRNHLIS